MSMNGAALMYREAGTLSLVLGAGNGVTPGDGGFGNVYTLNPDIYTDDDYGQVSSYYYTYGFVNRGAEQQLQVGSHQKDFSAFFLPLRGQRERSCCRLPRTTRRTSGRFRVRGR